MCCLAKGLHLKRISAFDTTCTSVDASRVFSCLRTAEINIIRVDRPSTPDDIVYAIGCGSFTVRRESTKDSEPSIVSENVGRTLFNYAR